MVGRASGASSSRIVNEIRRRFGSTCNTLTRTTSPGFATLRGSLTNALAIAEMCTNPSWWTPTSIKAPNAATFVTTPSRTMPGLRSSSFSTPSRKFAVLKAGRAIGQFKTRLFPPRCKRLSDEHDRGIVRLRGNRETELPAHPQHRLVLVQHLADEFTDAALPGDFDEAVHQQVAETASFPVAADGNRIFGAQFVGAGKEMAGCQRRPVDR